MSDTFFFWALAIAIGFPFVMLVLGEIVLKLRRAGRKRAEPLEALRVLVLPSLVLFIVLFRLIGLSRGTIPVRLAETLMWIAIIYTGLTFSNLFLFESADEGTWQANVPKILLDTGRFFLVLVGSAIVLSSVWGADLGGLLTALGVGSLVIGLALQDSLGNIFSGVALLFERPFKLGEWIQVGETVGKVEEITWRSVHLVTKAGNLVVVPNSELAKGSISNFNRPAPVYLVSLELSFSYDDPPNRVKKIVTETALATEGVLSNPAPRVLTENYGDAGIDYRIFLFIADFDGELTVREDFLTRIWYTSKRGGLTMPDPITGVYEYRSKAPTEEDQIEIARKSLASIPSLSRFPSETIELLSRRGVWLEYARNEIVVTEGETLPGMYLVLSGTVELSTTDRAGKTRSVATLSEGEFFGERASLLTDRIADVTARASDDPILLLLDTATIQFLLENSPHFANDLGESMELRRRTLQTLRG